MKNLSLFATFFFLSLTHANSQFLQLPFPSNLHVNLFKDGPNFAQTATQKEQTTSHLGLSNNNINDGDVQLTKKSDKPVFATLEEVLTTDRIVSNSDTETLSVLETTETNVIQARFGQSVTQSSTGKGTTKVTTAASIKKPLKKKECGVQVTTNRIVGGNETAIDEFPFLALLYYKSPKNGKLRYQCGGSLINTRTVLTASHCIEGELGKTLEFVRLGEWNTKTEKDCVSIGFNEEDCTDDPIDFKVKQILIHPARNAPEKTNDLALLILMEEPPYTDFIRPICLPTKTFEPPSSVTQALIVSGWGSVTQFIFVVSDIKMKLKVNHVVYKDCQAAYQKYNFTINKEKQICAGGERDKGTCAGDSGGPLMFFDTGKLYVVGIVSFGTKPCAEAGIPGVFVNVWSYMDWINQNAV